MSDRNVLNLMSAYTAQQSKSDQQSLQASATWYHGLTVFQKNTQGLLSLNGDVFKFEDQTGQALFTFQPKDLKVIKSAPTVLTIVPTVGKKLIVELTTSPRKDAVERAVTGALLPGQLYSDLVSASEEVDMTGWLQKLQHAGFTVKDRRIKLKNPRLFMIKWSFIFIGAWILGTLIIYLIKGPN